MGDAGAGRSGATRERTAPERTARERILDAAYGLFAREGVAQVGIDTVVARSGCCKASLYNQFGSKDGLAIAFLDRREERWTRGWLQAEITRRAATPGGRLLAIFDVFDEWFRKPGFEGCSFVNVLLESAQGSPVRSAAADHLERIRGVLRGLAVAEGLAEPERFVHVWHILMKGSIVTAGEGHRDAARDARRAAEMVLAGWPRR
jgi:AcrR family transcriptional regulator